MSLQVDEGAKYGIHQIVCGAPNARKGLKVIVAREGAVLPLVTSRKARSAASIAMGCAAPFMSSASIRNSSEEKQCAGIEELRRRRRNRQEDVLAYLGLDDAILDLDLAPFSERSQRDGERRRRSRRPSFSRSQIPESGGGSRGKDGLQSGNSLTAKCPLFRFAEAHDVVTKPSPEWLKRILEAEGVRSINNIVDIGNYVMLLTGQPLNMYDLDKLPAKELVVKDDLRRQLLGDGR
jgi:phenylalanyl-tRNA synthetase beta chain